MLRRWGARKWEDEDENGKSVKGAQGLSGRVEWSSQVRSGRRKLAYDQQDGMVPDPDPGGQEARQDKAREGARVLRWCFATVKCGAVRYCFESSSSLNPKPAFVPAAILSCILLWYIVSSLAWQCSGGRRQAESEPLYECIGSSERATLMVGHCT